MPPCRPAESRAKGFRRMLPAVRLIQKLKSWLEPEPPDPDELRAAQEANFDRETIKTGAFDAPPMLQGQKWPRE